MPTRGWRPLVDAKGIAEFDENNGSVGDVVWMKKMDNLTRIPLPDGRWVERTMIEYVSLDPDLSSGNYTEWSSPVGDWKKIPSWGWEANDTDLEYFKPNGLYGFVDAPDFNETLIESPAVHNKNGSDDQKADIYSVFYVDNDSEESITIIDQGHGFNGLDHNITNGFPFSPLEFLISGKGFRPGTYVDGTVISTDVNESNTSEGSISPGEVRKTGMMNLEIQ